MYLLCCAVSGNSNVYITEWHSHSLVLRKYLLGNGAHTGLVRPGSWRCRVVGVQERNDRLMALFFELVPPLHPCPDPRTWAPHRE